MERIGAQWRQRLISCDMPLHPVALQSVLPKYGSFLQVNGHDGLRMANHAACTEEMPSSRKVVLLLSGPAASGKDAIRKKIDELMPGLTRKLVTATSRPRRENESEGKDYYFFDGVDAFRQAIAEKKFLEFSPQGSSRDGSLRLYGTPKQSIQDALLQPEPVIVSTVEMSEGWPHVRRYVRSLPNPPTVIRMFVIPEMRSSKYFGSWLQEQRPNDYVERGVRSGWEFWHAPQAADVLVSNRIDEGEAGLASAAAQAVELLTHRFIAR